MFLLDCPETVRSEIMDANSTLLGLAVYASLRTKQADIPTFRDIGLQSIYEPEGQHFDIE